MKTKPCCPHWLPYTTLTWVSKYDRQDGFKPFMDRQCRRKKSAKHAIELLYKEEFV